MKKFRFSLRTGLITTILLCWLIPIVLIMVIAGYLMSTNYQKYIRQELDTGIRNAMTQVSGNLEDIFESSKAVSYDGVVRSAYRTYLDEGDSASLYRTVTEYLTQNFSREDRIEAVFLTFREEAVNGNPYLTRQGTASYETLRAYRTQVEPQIIENMESSSAGIYLIQSDGKLYVARNLLDSHFHAYAAVVILCDTQLLLQPYSAVTQLSNMQICLDQCAWSMDKEGGLLPISPSVPAEGSGVVVYHADIEEHPLTFSAKVSALNLWTDTPGLQMALLVVVLMVVPLMFLVVTLFYRHVSRPMETLVEATSRVQSGQRGYVIEQATGSEEFQKIYSHFNAMSTELQNQFERSYLEQQALTQAKIKALQSQINPHFLNNTLEIINWEARFAGADQVVAMIEALSVMLDAALDRDGRSQIPLREELGYVDAYLYIITRRLGDGLKIQKEISEHLLDRSIPRLVLQPIVENAVEHDITVRKGGTICIRAYEADGGIVLEVEHDGTMTDADRQKIQELLALPAGEVVTGGQVGLRNVNQRLNLIYADRGRLTVREIHPGSILAQVYLPQ